MNYTNNIQRCHEAAKANGWWDEPLDIQEKLGLVHTEIVEAYECYRSGEYCGTKYSSEDFTDVTLRLGVYCPESIQFFKNNVKETFECEVADIAIRLYDLAGALGITFDTIPPMTVADVSIIVPDNNFQTTFINSYPMVNCWLSLTRYETTPDVHKNIIQQGLEFCRQIAINHNFALQDFINMKLAYNKSRGYRHGGKKH